MSSSNTELWKNFPELLKLQTTLVSFLYVVLGFCLTAITGHNAIAFGLSQGGMPDSFIPVGPIFAKMVFFTTLNITWVVLGLAGAFIENLTLNSRRYLSWACCGFFVMALLYFSYILFHLSHAFGF